MSKRMYKHPNAPIMGRHSVMAKGQILFAKTSKWKVRRHRMPQKENKRKEKGGLKNFIKKYKCVANNSKITGTASFRGSYIFHPW